MTKQEQKEYLQKFVASQGTQAGLSITPLLEAIINGNDDIFVVTVEDNAENTKKVTNPQEDITISLRRQMQTHCTTRRKFSLMGLFWHLLKLKYQRTK